MKKTLLFAGVAAAGLMLSSCSSPERVSIEGNIAGLPDSTKVYLNVPQDRGMEAVDSVMTLGGKFQFKDSAYVHPRFFYFTVENTPTAYPIFMGKEVVKINGDVNAKKAFDIVAGKDQQLFNDFQKQTEAIGNEYMTAVQEYQAVENKEDTAKIRQLEEKINAIVDQGDSLFDTFIEENPNSLLTPSLIYPNLYKFDYAKLDAAFKKMGGDAKYSPFYKKIEDKVKIMEAVQVGKIAPDFTLPDSNGEDVSLSSLKGNVILLDFWASWCGPCRRENPNVVAIHNDYKDKGLKVIGVSLDTDRKAWLEAIQADKLFWTQVSTLDASDRPAADLYGVTGIPHIVVIDKDFKIVAKGLHGEELRQEVEKLIQ
ncbi:MAG: redoxin domain-containing protein [Bacteroidales bacterium]